MMLREMSEEERDCLHLDRTLVKQCKSFPEKCSNGHWRRKKGNEDVSLLSTYLTCPFFASSIYSHKSVCVFKQNTSIRAQIQSSKAKEGEEEANKEKERKEEEEEEEEQGKKK